MDQGVFGLRGIWTERQNGQKGVMDMMPIVTPGTTHEPTLFIMQLCKAVIETLIGFITLSSGNSIVSELREC